MDLGTIGGWVVSALGGGLGGGALIKVWEERRRRQDKIEERRVSRDDSYRTDLRLAYARFIASGTKLIALSEQLHAMAQTIEAQRNSARTAAAACGATPAQMADIYWQAGHPDLVNRVRDTIEEFVVSTVDANGRLVEVMLLESDATMQRRLLALFESPLTMLVGAHDLDRFAADVGNRKSLLDNLTRALVGTFAEQQWESRSSSRPTEASPAR